MKTKDKKKKTGSSAASKTAEKTQVASNPRLVAALKASDQAKMAFTGTLVAIATVTQEEQLTRAEVVASLMEARAVTKETAESQYSRMKKLLTDPELLEQLKNGEIDLKTARQNTTTKQKNPSAAKKKENIEKRFNKALATLIEAAKDGGMDKASLVNSVKSACKKAGIV